MSARETIVAAAIRRGILIYSAPKPARHGDVIRLIDENHGSAHEVFQPDEQGFLTNKGRFVSRRDAADLAIRARQILRLSWPPDLYSEDLW